MNFNFGKQFTAIMLAVAVLIGAVSFAVSQSIEGKGEVRIVAKQLADGRIEFGLEQDGERVLPRSRFFPANAKVDTWLRSSPVSINEARVTTRSTPPSPQQQTITHSHCQRVRNDGGCDRRYRPARCPTHTHQSLVGHRNDHC